MQLKLNGRANQLSKGAPKKRTESQKPPLKSIAGKGITQGIIVNILDSTIRILYTPFPFPFPEPNTLSEIPTVRIWAKPTYKAANLTKAVSTYPFMSAYYTVVELVWEHDCL